MTLHIIGLLVEDRPGVFARISGLVFKRGFNIETICVGKSEKPGISRIILTINADDRTLEQVKKQLGKLIDVVKISDLPKSESVVRELLLVKVNTKDSKKRADIIAFAKSFRASVVDVSAKSLVIQLAGQPSKIGAFLELMRPFGIHEISRTGTNAMSRGPKSLSGEEAVKTGAKAKQGGAKAKK
ncbi:MAG: acetolactate synthase small subunit [Candidatus Diapherotrites archaeon]|nr:acetolactate synthase small subunit [Candidatus Diapherotrites archaeon]